MQTITDSPAEAMGNARARAAHSIASLEERLGYSFRNLGLLEQSLTHSSRAHELRASSIDATSCDNESMEFLGDALLGGVVAEWLFRNYPGYGEGRLTRMRSALVSRKALAVAAQRMQLGTYVRLGKGEEQSGGRHKAALLADTVEAVMAAVYLDGGLDPLIKMVERLIIRHEGASLRAAADPDAKSALQEWFQSHHIPKPAYNIVCTEGPEHEKEFTVEMELSFPEEASEVARGVGRSKKQAEQECARQALKLLSARTEAE